MAGVQKAGTTTLFRYLAQHPNLIAPRRKETHFFDDEKHSWAEPDYRLLDSWFDVTVAGCIRFDATPIYCFWPPALDRILDYNPDARIILVFRDPAARAVSQWRMERSRNTETLSFAEAIRAEPARLAAVPFDEAAWRDKSYVARGRYGEQLARVLARFPQSQVMTLRSDEMHRCHRQTLEMIAGFLEIPAFPEIPQVHEFPSTNDEVIQQEDLVYVRRILGDDLRRFSLLSGLDVSDWLYD